MPEGLAVLYWNDRVGFEIIGKYPKNLEFEEKLLLQLFSQHEYTGEHGMVSLKRETINVISYYTGDKIRVYIALFLNNIEDSDDFESILMEITQKILPHSKSEEELNNIFPDLFRKITEYSLFFSTQKEGEK